MENQQNIDPELWRIARKRAGFKRHFATYLVINLFLWVIWWFGDRRMLHEDDYTSIPWPIFPTLGWGIGILMNFLGAYVFYNKRSSIEREYEKLKSK